MKILFITLSNIGDVILTLPVLDYLKGKFSDAAITVMSGPRAREIFEIDPRIASFIAYDKHAPLKEKIRLFNKLKKEYFDMVVDLRNTFFGVFLPASSRTPFLRIIPKNIKHMKEKHLYQIPDARAQSPFKMEPTPQPTAGWLPLGRSIKNDSLCVRPQDEEYVKRLLRENNIKEGDGIIVVSAGARSHIKRWAKEKFSDLIPLLIKEFAAKIILVGDKEDMPINKYIAGRLSYSLLDSSGRTTLLQLACLLKKARLVITNDSAVLHTASYLNIPVVAIFGPTDDLKYGPWSADCAVVRRSIFCSPCQKAQCRFGTLECMSLIKVEDVLRQVRNTLAAASAPQRASGDNDSFKRVLIVRTDRIGDVLLSTPVIKALRVQYPKAYIAMMVSPYAKDIVEGNPYLDEVIIYDKDGRHKSWLSSIKFALNIRKRRFDLAFILHPANRVHLVTFFAGIPRRIGYERKFGFLLTDRIKHTKQCGEKHELEYNLDLLRYLGIAPEDKSLFMPIKNESERCIEDVFRQEGIKEQDKLLAIHPGASCPSKIWPSERFAEVADRLESKYGFKVLLIAGPKDIILSENVIKNMRHRAVNLAGKTSVSQLASVLKRCRLFISNDSGPVHIASAVGTPVISIFGRNQKGLSPKRWGPLGIKDKVLHREVGCIECLAHNCAKSFACLKAITVDDVLRLADSILRDAL
jgi:heptosyltransferase-2